MSAEMWVKKVHWLSQYRGSTLNADSGNDNSGGDGGDRIICLDQLLINVNQISHVLNFFL